MWDVDLCWKTSWRAHSPTVVSSSIWSGSDYPIFGMGWPGLIHWFAIIRSMLIRSQLFYGRVPTCVILKSRKFRWQNVPDKDCYSPPPSSTQSENVHLGHQEKLVRYYYRLGLVDVLSDLHSFPMKYLINLIREMQIYVLSKMIQYLFLAIEILSSDNKMF